MCSACKSPFWNKPKVRSATRGWTRVIERDVRATVEQSRRWRCKGPTGSETLAELSDALTPLRGEKWGESPQSLRGSWRDVLQGCSSQGDEGPRAREHPVRYNRCPRRRVLRCSKGDRERGRDGAARGGTRASSSRMRGPPGSGSTSGPKSA